MPGNNPARGDIYHIDFPEPLGPHYAVVVTADALNVYSIGVVVAVITSQHMDDIAPHQFRIPNGFLRRPSKVQCDALVMLPKEELTSDNWMDTISKKDMQGLDVALMKALDLWY